MAVLSIAPPTISTLRVIEVDPQCDPRWEPFVATHPAGSIYHHPAWLQVLTREYPQRSLFLVCECADGQLRGILPLMHTRGLPWQGGGLQTGRRLSSLPRTPLAGPLALDDRASAVLLRAAVERICSERHTRLQIKMPSAQLDGLVSELVSRPWRQTYVLELPKQPDQIRFGNSRNHGRIKAAINKAARLGVHVRTAETEDDLRAWYTLYLETMRWHAVPPRSYRFFQATWELLRPRGLMQLLLAEHQEQLLAGSLFLMFGHTVTYAFNGSRREDLALQPNYAIQWRSIQDACRAGYRYYDFGEVEEENPSLAQFKSKWGAEATWLYRYYYPAPDEPEAGVDRFAGHTRQVVHAAWRRLPLTVTATLGDWLYSYL